MFSARTLALVPLVLLGLTACGDGEDAADTGSGAEPKAYADTSVKQIGKDVEAAMKDLTSVHLKGRIVDDGEAIVMDVSISTSGDCVGSMKIPGTGSFRLIAVDGVSYFKADEAFWRSQAGGDADAAMKPDRRPVGHRLLRHRGLRRGSATSTASWASLKSDDVSGKGSKVTGTKKVAGKDAVGVSFTSDDGNPGVAWVASSDPHYFLRWDVKKEGAVTLSQFDVPVNAKRPAASDTVDLAKARRLVPRQAPRPGSR
ncbi:hypothetical protein G5V59_19765 [Nocardioides sp. W3-2-3]|uniref:hypothetical protein n=1 Tax=Nocardioides convexus TaxID=2712224 RepID=UPI0024185E01|nr:hypothetical protein [Nocardioides convexus]NHA01324.1 hypothetical protein [Nocardioides convexus]